MSILSIVSMLRETLPEAQSVYLRRPLLSCTDTFFKFRPIQQIVSQVVAYGR